MKSSVEGWFAAANFLLSAVANQAWTQFVVRLKQWSFRFIVAFVCSARIVDMVFTPFLLIIDYGVRGSRKGRNDLLPSNAAFRASRMPADPVARSMDRRNSLVLGNARCPRNG